MPWWEPYETAAEQRTGRPVRLAPLRPEKPAWPRPDPLVKTPEPEPFAAAPERRSLLRDVLDTVVGVWGLRR